MFLVVSMRLDCPLTSAWHSSVLSAAGENCPANISIGWESGKESAATAFYSSATSIVRFNSGEHRCDHSITSSARAMIDGGTVRPSALAAVMLINRSNFEGCSTGRSLGAAPFRILST